MSEEAFLFFTITVPSNRGCFQLQRSRPYFRFPNGFCGSGTAIDPLAPANHFWIKRTASSLQHRNQIFAEILLFSDKVHRSKGVMAVECRDVARVLIHHGSDERRKIPSRTQAVQHGIRMPMIDVFQLSILFPVE